MNNISVMIKPASSACNMRCRYCFYADVSRARAAYSYGMMSPETARAVLDGLFASLGRGDRLGLTFQGGEPTLAGLDFFEAFVRGADERAAARGVAVSYALQTNGLMLDDRFCAFLARHKFLTGLSMDAYAAAHDRNRVDVSGRGTWQAVSAARARLDAHGAAYNMVAVLTNDLARHPESVWRAVNEGGIEYLQLIPCLASLEGGEAEPWALTPGRFASFYTALFRLWRDALDRGVYRSVKLFDDLVNLLAWGAVNACGLVGECVPQVVVEADGGVYPCDFYVTDAWRAGSLAEQPLGDILASPVYETFRRRGTPRPAACEGCPHRALCGGGCPRMREAACVSARGGACGYRAFLDECLPGLMAVARAIRAGRGFQTTPFGV